MPIPERLRIDPEVHGNLEGMELVAQVCTEAQQLLYHSGFAPLGVEVIERLTAPVHYYIPRKHQYNNQPEYHEPNHNDDPTFSRNYYEIKEGAESFGTPDYFYRTIRVY